MQPDAQPPTLRGRRLLRVPDQAYDASAAKKQSSTASTTTAATIMADCRIWLSCHSTRSSQSSENLSPMGMAAPSPAPRWDRARKARRSRYVTLRKCRDTFGRAWTASATRHSYLTAAAGFTQDFLTWPLDNALCARQGAYL